MTELILQQLTEEERATVSHTEAERARIAGEILAARRRDLKAEAEEGQKKLEAVTKRFEEVYSAGAERVLATYSAAELFDIVAAEVERQTQAHFEARNERAKDNYNELREMLLNRQMQINREEIEADIAGLLDDYENTRENYRKFITNAVAEDLEILLRKSPDHAKRIEGLIYRKAAKCYAPEKQYKKRTAENIQRAPDKPYLPKANGILAQRSASALYALTSGGIERYADGLAKRRHEKIEARSTRDTTGAEWFEIYEPTKEGETGIRIPAKKSGNTAAVKLFNFLLTQIPNRKIDEEGQLYSEILFPLSKLVESQVYANIESARTAFYSAWDILYPLQIAVFGNNRTYGGFALVFRSWYIDKAGNCHIEFQRSFPYLHDILRYFCYWPAFFYALTDKTQRLEDIIHSRAQMNRAEIRKAGRFKIKIATIAAEMNLPPLIDANGKRNPKHLEEIRQPIINAADEINAAEKREMNKKKETLLKDGKAEEAAALKQETKLKFSVVQNAAIDEFLNGDLIISFSGQIKELYSVIPEAEKEQARENAKRAARKKKASGRGKA